MSKKAGSVAPQERINIKYVPSIGDQQAEVELPLKLLVIGDFKGQKEESNIEDRTTVRIDKDNFNSVLEKSELTLDLQVPSKLTENQDNTLDVHLEFNSIQDFDPDSVANQVPELAKLLELRNALVALKGPLGNIPAFRKQIQDILSDSDVREKLTSELNHILEKPVK